MTHTASPVVNLPGGRCRGERAVQLQRGEQRGAAAEEAPARRPGCRVSELSVAALEGPAYADADLSTLHERAVSAALEGAAYGFAGSCGPLAMQSAVAAAGCSSRALVQAPILAAACEARMQKSCARLASFRCNRIAQFDAIVTRRAASHQTPLHRLGAVPQVDSLSG